MVLWSWGTRTVSTVLPLPLGAHDAFAAPELPLLPLLLPHAVATSPTTTTTTARAFQPRITTTDPPTSTVHGPVVSAAPPTRDGSDRRRRVRRRVGPTSRSRVRRSVA